MTDDAPVTAAGEWEEAKHPRGEHGHFRKLDEIMGDLRTAVNASENSRVTDLSAAMSAVREGKRGQARTHLDAVAEQSGDPKVQALVAEAKDRLKPIKVSKGVGEAKPGYGAVVHQVHHPDHGHIGTIEKHIDQHHVTAPGQRISIGTTQSTSYRAIPKGVSPYSPRDRAAGGAKDFRTRAEAEHHLAETADAKAIAAQGAAGDSGNQPQTPATGRESDQAVLDRVRSRLTVRQVQEVINGTNDHGVTVREQAVLKRNGVSSADKGELPGPSDSSMGGGPDNPAWDRLMPSEIQPGDTISHPASNRPIQVKSTVHGPTGINVAYDDNGTERNVLLPHHTAVPRTLPEQAPASPDPRAAADQSIEARRAKTAAIIKEAADKYAATGDAKHLETIDRARAAEQAGYARDVQAYVPEGADVPPARGIGRMERDAAAANAESVAGDNLPKGYGIHKIGINAGPNNPNGDPAYMPVHDADGAIGPATPDREAAKQAIRDHAAGRMRNGADALRQAAPDANEDPVVWDDNATKAWKDIHPDFKSTKPDGTRSVLGRTRNGGTVSIPWRGPSGGAVDRPATIMNKPDTTTDNRAIMQKHDLPTLQRMASDGNLRQQDRQMAREELARRGEAPASAAPAPGGTTSPAGTSRRAAANKPVGSIVHVRQPGGTQRLGTVTGVDGQHRHVELNPIGGGTQKEKIRVHASQITPVENGAAPGRPVASPSGRSAKMQRAFQAASEGDHTWLEDHGFDARPGDSIHVNDETGHIALGKPDGTHSVHRVNGNGQAAGMGQRQPGMGPGDGFRKVHEPRTGGTAMPTGSAPDGGVRGTQSDNPAAKAMTERILANRAGEGAPADERPIHSFGAKKVGNKWGVFPLRRPADDPYGTTEFDKEPESLHSTQREAIGRAADRTTKVRNAEREAKRAAQSAPTATPTAGLDKYGVPADKTNQQLGSQMPSLPADHRQIADDLKARYMPTGPEHDRGISDDLRRYYLLNNQGGRDGEAAYWLRSAEEQAARKQGATPAPGAEANREGGLTQASTSNATHPMVNALITPGENGRNEWPIRSDAHDAAASALDRASIKTKGGFNNISENPDGTKTLTLSHSVGYDGNASAGNRWQLGVNDQGQPVAKYISGSAPNDGSAYQDDAERAVPIAKKAVEDHLRSLGFQIAGPNDTVRPPKA